MKHKVVKEYDLNEQGIEKYLDDGYTLLGIIPDVKSFYNATQFVTRQVFFFMKEVKE